MPLIKYSSPGRPSLVGGKRKTDRKAHSSSLASVHVPSPLPPTSPHSSFLLLPPSACIPMCVRICLGGKERKKGVKIIRQGSSSPLSLSKRCFPVFFMADQKMRPFSCSSIPVNRKSNKDRSGRNNNNKKKEHADEKKQNKKRKK